MDFSAWFSSGCYGGLACCMLAVATNALYTTLYRRGTTRQLAGAIIICVVCALLLLPAVTWYNMRFTVEQTSLPAAEVQVMLAYVALFGWFLPLNVTISYCLFTTSRLLTTSMEIPRQKRRTKLNPATAQLPPRQPGVPAPFVFNEETPWGWLEHRGGRFQGQRLALTRAIVTLGRDEDNDIWLDDDMASRHHAELAWNDGNVYLTDCDSLNGVLLNGKRIHGSELVKPGEPIEIGTHRFLFLLAEQPKPLLEMSDPLAHHTWRSSLESLTVRSHALPATRPLQDNDAIEKIPTTSLGTTAEGTPEMITDDWQETASFNKVTPFPLLPEKQGAVIICDGELAGKTFLLDRSVISVGRGTECDIVIDDVSISRRHAQFLRQFSGNYVQDLTSRNGTMVNDQPLVQPHLLRFGDFVCLGNIRLEYVPAHMVQNTPLPQIITPQSFARSMSGPVPLKLPSKQQEAQ